MSSKTKVRFMENFLKSAENYFTDADLTRIALHLARYPDDGIASDVSDRLRLIPWLIRRNGTTDDKSVIVWFLVHDDLSSIDVIALDDDDELDDGSGIDDDDDDARKKLERISRLLYRAYRLGARVQDLLDAIGSSFGS